MQERLVLITRRLKNTKRVIPIFLENGDEIIACKLQENQTRIKKEIAILKYELKI